MPSRGRSISKTGTRSWNTALVQAESPQNLRDYQEVIYRNRAPTVISWGTCAQLHQICCPIICRDFLYGYIGMAPPMALTWKKMASAIEAMFAKTLGRILNDEQRTDVLAPEQYVSHLLMRDKPDHKVLVPTVSILPAVSVRNAHASGCK